MSFLALNTPNNCLPFRNKGVSGEFKYFGSPDRNNLPPKAITLPLLFKIGIISLS